MRSVTSISNKHYQHHLSYSVHNHTVFTINIIPVQAIRLALLNASQTHHIIRFFFSFLFFSQPIKLIFTTFLQPPEFLRSQPPSPYNHHPKGPTNHELPLSNHHPVSFSTTQPHSTSSSSRNQARRDAAQRPRPPPGAAADLLARERDTRTHTYERTYACTYMLTRTRIDLYESAAAPPVCLPLWIYLCPVVRYYSAGEGFCCT